MADGASRVASAGGAPILEVRELVKHYPIRGGLFSPSQMVHALDGVSLSVARGETLAVVGESGCGKSTLARCIIRLEQPTSGHILLKGADITVLAGRPLRELRRALQIVFQDPYASLNPRWSIASLIGDPMRLHGLAARGERRGRVASLLETVGLGPEFMDRYPHELSGGQRQRVAIARALAMQPEVIVCDEPVSALDVSIQAQVINLLKRLQRQFGIAYIFISHDLSLVKHISDRVAVMYLGQIVELAETRAARRRVLHPYSQALFSAAPVADPQAAAARKRIILAGDVPSPIEPPSGCRFHTRCPYRQDRCAREAPQLRAVEDRLVRCHFAGEPGFPPEVPA
ncbi:MAG: dipeptide ABC transporter ATP-binding protein [Alphaproteobacteria bacterium]|nr:dipeptide ABC transporter ATP-binding protein [Alphaproteobacteria bacterium]